MNILSTQKIACRIWDMTELVSHMVKNVKVWTWAARNYSNFHNQVLRFRVSGHHHKGYVYISLNSMDTFDIYFTNLQNVIKTEIRNVYIEDLISTIDKVVEYIPEYQNR